MKLDRLNHKDSTEDGQQGVGYTRGQETELQAMEVDQSNDQELDPNLVCINFEFNCAFKF